MEEQCCASRVLVYSTVFGHDVIMGSVKVNSCGAEVPSLAIGFWTLTQPTLSTWNGGT